MTLGRPEAEARLGPGPPRLPRPLPTPRALEGFPPSRHIVGPSCAHAWAAPQRGISVRAEPGPKPDIIGRVLTPSLEVPHGCVPALHRPQQGVREQVPPR